LPVSETVSPLAVFATVMTRTGRISGAGGSSADLHAASTANKSASKEAARAEWTFLPVSELADNARSSSVDIFRDRLY
jgi:hypothetical protein